MFTLGIYFLGALSMVRAAWPRGPYNHKTTFLRHLTDPEPNINVSENYFNQLLDHNNPSAGTFKQRYYFTEGYWTKQGAPIVIMNPGEQAADGFDNYLGDKASLQRAIMQATGAAGVVIEHRYWGNSSPYQNLSTENMKYLFVDQAIEDTKYFVENVKLPWKKKTPEPKTHPDTTPWINFGCSYPGLLTAWTQEKYSDTFAAAWASSAPVQAIGDFWQYYEPIVEGMPKNCSADAAAVIQAVDHTLTIGIQQDKVALKEQFGLQDLEDDDMADSLAFPLYVWQGLVAETVEHTSWFQQWCDAMETLSDGTFNKNAAGVGMPAALTNFAKWYKTNYPDQDCPGGLCYGTYNYTSDLYTDWSVGNYYDRQWYWMICNEFGWFQDGDPSNSSSIVSSLVTEAYNLRLCNHMFPNADGTLGNFTPSVDNINTQWKGWNVQASNLFVVNGQYDPWRAASVSSNWAPGFEDGPYQDVEVIEGGHHCWDWDMSGAKYNSDIKRVVDKGVSLVRGWVTEWYQAHKNVTDSLPNPVPNYWGNLLN